MTDAWVSLVQTSVWIVFIGGGLFLTRRRWGIILDALVQRILEGAPLGLGPVNIGSPPAALKRGEAGGATAEGTKGATASSDLVKVLSDRTYPAELTDEYYLLHATQVVRPRTATQPGLYRVRVWLEADDAELLGSVRRVTYRLHDTFDPKVIATEARGRNFELWMNIYGEFIVVAALERGDSSPVFTTRYLDLPGRPPE